ncbi:MAG: hypothetical protein WC804_02095 [Sphingomonas sp.]|uniref:hypothetical protein n=1 Tax=Sphingomonas sp. TaxID=28214 RepID=UPI0035634446
MVTVLFMIQTVHGDGTTGVTNIAAAALSHRQIPSTAGTAGSVVGATSEPDAIASDGYFCAR